jgi:glycosyltransferase involved in cell wall biosynthesis
MRVGLVIHRFPPDGRGGTETHAALSRQALVARGHDVEVFAGRPGDARRVRQEPGVCRVETPLTEEHALALPDPWVSAEFEGWLDDTAPDVVHVHHLLFLAPDLIERAKRRGIPVVVTLHDLWFTCALVHADVRHAGRAWGASCFAHSELRPPLRALSRLRRRRLRSRLEAHLARPHHLRAQLALADHVLAPSCFLQERHAAFGIDGVEVLPHPVAVRPRGPQAPRTPVRFGFVGPLARHKGIEVLRAAATAAGIEPVLVGPGDPPGFGEWVGEVEHGVIEQALAGIDVLVVPSLAPESFSLVAHEAQALGIPVVASSIGALPEVVEHGVNGLLVPPGKPRALAQALRQLSDPDEVARLQSGACTPLAPGEHARRLEDLYSACTSQPRIMSASTASVTKCVA